MPGTFDAVAGLPAAAPRADVRRTLAAELVDFVAAGPTYMYGGFPQFGILFGESLQSGSSLYSKYRGFCIVASINQGSFKGCVFWVDLRQVES